jgi:hypothetical protein
VSRWTVFAALALALFATPAAADEAKAPAKSKREIAEERAKYATDARTSRILGKAREALAADRSEEVKRQLDRLRLDRLNTAGRAQANRLYGYLAYGQQQNVAAIDHLQKSLAEDGLPPADRADVLFQVAQIQGAERRWKDALATLDAWFAIVEKPNSVGYFLQAVSHYQLDDLDAALLPATKAVQIASKPQSPWLQLLLAIHLTKKDYVAAAPVLTQLIELYPEVGKGYWVQLSALYGAMDNHERALAVMEVAYRKGLLTEDRDLRRLVQLMLFQQVPERAAKIVEVELANGRLRQDSESLELLSSAWLLAREAEKAEEPLARAAELAPKGDLFVRLAQVQFVQEEYTKAAHSLRKALDKGGLADPGGAQLLLGITYFNDERLDEARTWFARAQGSPTTRKQARTWLEHVEREREKGDT